MVRPFAILAVVLWTCTGAQGQSTNNEVHIRATVKAVAPLTTVSGTITPVGVDPRFALALRIESAAPPDDSFRAGAVVTLGIHSPSLLFGGESSDGKTYDFVLHRTVEDSRVRYFAVTARKVRDHRRATEPETIGYCQVLKAPAAFGGKTVRITGVYLYTFENQRLLPSSCCEDRDLKTWVEFGDLDSRSRKLWRRFPEGTGMVLATFVGRLDYADHPQFQGSQLQYTIAAIEHVERVAKGKEITNAAWKPPFCKQ